MTEQIFQLAEEIREDSSLSEYESVDLAIKMKALEQQVTTNDLLSKISENINYINRNIQRR